MTDGSRYKEVNEKSVYFLGIDTAHVFTRMTESEKTVNV